MVVVAIILTNEAFRVVAIVVQDLTGAIQLVRSWSGTDKALAAANKAMYDQS